MSMLLALVVVSVYEAKQKNKQVVILLSCRGTFRCKQNSWCIIRNLVTKI